jgi:ABC-type phosphate/phosphonate transport system substrate-binding protein
VTEQRPKIGERVVITGDHYLAGHRANVLSVKEGEVRLSVLWPDSYGFRAERRITVRPEQVRRI